MLLKLDIFGEPVVFTIDGEGSQKSYLGLMLSLCIFATVFPYSYNKFNTLRTHNDTVKEEFIDPEGK